MMKLILLSIIGCLTLGIVNSTAQTKYDNGQQLFDQKRYKEALKSFQGIIKESPKDEKAWYLLGKTLLQMSLYDSAEVAARKAIYLEDELFDAYVVLSEVQLAKKNGLGVLETIKAGTKVLRKKEFPLFFLETAKAYLMLDSNDAALVAFTKYGEYAPNDYRSYEGKGDVYAKQKVEPMAINQYERALDLDSTLTQVIYKLANIYKKNRQYTEASRIYRKLLNLEPENEKARLELAMLFYRAKLWLNCAVTLKDYFDKEKNPPKETQLIYMESLYKSHYYKEALQVAEQVLKTEPNHALALRIAGLGYAEQKQYQQSIGSYTKLAKIDTMQFEDLKRLGYVYRQVKNDSLAVLAYIDALKLDSTQANLYGEVGAIFMSQRKWDKAAYYLERRIKLDTTAVAGYINLALCLMQSEKYEQAVIRLEKAVDLNPEYPPSYLNMGFCYTGMKEFVESRKWFMKAIKVVDTAESKYKLLLADANKMIGLSFLVDKPNPDNPKKKWEDGVLYLERALKYKEDDAQTHVWLGQAFQNLQKIEDAIKHYKRGRQLDPKNKDAIKGLEVLEPKQ